MLNYLEILDRANSGPYITEENWDLEKVAMTARRLVKKYKLGATSATLSLTGVTTNQAGNYTCVVGNAAGTVTSAAATLTVLEIVPNYAPSISLLSDVHSDKYADGRDSLYHWRRRNSRLESHA